MASGIFRKIVEENDMEGKLFCMSAGLSAVVGEPPSKLAIEAAREIGIDISEYKSRKFMPEDTQTWDLYFPMSKTQAYILEKAGVPNTKIYTPSYIDDPFGGTIEDYRKCRDKLEKEILKFYNDVVLRLLPFDHGYEYDLGDSTDENRGHDKGAYS